MARQRQSSERLPLAHNIRTRREQMAMTQAQLAQEVGLGSAQVVSQIEKGEREVKATELAAIARALHCRLADLLDELPESSHVAWRNRPIDGGAKDQARFLEHCQAYHLVEQWTHSKVETTLPMLEHKPMYADYAWAEDVAEMFRNGLLLGDYPAVTLHKILEDRYGVKIFFIPDLSGSAASTLGPFGAAMALKAREVYTRHNYSMAHELFHLVSWKIFPPRQEQQIYLWDKSIETLADNFAAALLLPRRLFIDRVDQLRSDGTVSASVIRLLSEEFAVSRQAVVWRLVNIGMAKKDEAQILINSSINLGETPNYEEVKEWPDRFLRLLRLAYLEGEVAAGRVAEMLALPLTKARVTLDQWEKDAEHGELALRPA